MKKKQDKIQKAKKEIKEAEDAVFDVAESYDGSNEDSLIRAERDLEKAEAELDEVDEY